MFTGIVQGMARITAIQEGDHLRTCTLDLGVLAEGLQTGASVSVGGVCLTATEIEGTLVRFCVIGETLERTTFSTLRVGDFCNIERSARVGDEVGGHVVSGHVVGTVRIVSVETPGDNWIVTFECPPAWRLYLFPKGFVALDGCSLTLVDVLADRFTVHLIPETRTRTTFGMKRAGDAVHLEIDSMTRVIVDTVTRLTSSL